MRQPEGLLPVRPVEGATAVGRKPDFPYQAMGWLRTKVEADTARPPSKHESPRTTRA
jgi:hypothetical protein